MRMLSMRRVFVYLSSVGFLLLLCDLTGIHRHLLEKDYDTEFSYPLEVADFPSLVQKYRNSEPVPHDPINEVASNLKFISKAIEGCATASHRLIILVKSAPRNFETRDVIRVTWGNPKRFSDVQLKTVFLIGTDKGEDFDNAVVHEGQELADTSSLNEAILKESSKYGDIIQGDFHDTENNSTVKTLMGLRWLVETCPKFRFALIVNEGMYVSVKNMLKFIRHPSEYPVYWEKQMERDRERLLKESVLRVPRAVRADDSKHRTLNNLASDDDHRQGDDKILKKKQEPVLKKPIKVWKNSPIDFDIDMAEDVKLYAGNVGSGATHRHKLGTKYFLPIEEYPFTYMPPYVSTEAIVLSKPAVLDMYYASFFTKYLRLDDIFLGICAKKLNMYPFHSEHFQIDPHLVHDPYGKDNTYVLTADNFNEPERLQKFWNIQKSKGNA